MASIYYGQNSPFEIISKTHGKQLLGFVESFEVDASHANKRLYFFFKKEALAISIFEGVSGRFGYLETEERKLIAAIMDVDPNPSTGLINDDPSAYYEFNLLLNVCNEEGTIENGIVVKGCRVAGIPESLTPREEQHGQISYIGATRYKIKGGAILYNRIVSSAPPYSSPDDIVATDNGGTLEATLPHAPTEVNIENNSTTRNYLMVYKNGVDITKDPVAMAPVTVGAGVGLDEVHIVGMAPTDVYDIYTAYKP